MREIKFRVWSENMWLDGNDAMIHVNPLVSDITEIELEAGHPLKRYIMCQYTGLKDKNGKEIYEGDIVQYDDPMWNFKPEQVHIGVIIWRENNAAFICERRLIDGKAVKPEYGMSGLELKWHAVVIGNIYENPELVKEK